ncbi:MAG: HTH-type transcriptional repressor NicS [Syntrophorhabdaceae bacterium PtaU1.Bin034]|nr:MAG: HTH-type transcriptional repressor NicS [Syntrophorhabdaceae bacterium PtaU1.Bin034]
MIDKKSQVRAQSGLERGMAVKDKPRLRKKKVNPDKTLESLLDAATKLFLAKGYEATSIGEIAATAKLTKPTLYYYFDSKNDLLFSVHMKGIERDLVPYMEKVRAISDPDARCRTMVREYTKMICSDPALRFLLHGSLDIKDKYSKEIKKAWKEHYHLLRDTIEELQSKGIFNSNFKPAPAALLILGMITWITYWYDYGKVSSRRTTTQNQSTISEQRREKADDIANLVEMIVFQGLSRQELE